jgi:hypothetical protein
MHPSSNTASAFKKSSTEALTYTSAIPLTSAQLSNPLFPVCSKPSPDFFAFNSTEQRQIDIYTSASNTVVVSPVPPVSQGKMYNQQIPEDSPQVPFERQLSPSTNLRREPSPGSVPTIAWPISFSLNHPLTDATEASQITVRPGGPLDLGVFDWKSISNPLVETTISMSTCRLPYLPCQVYSGSSFLESDRSTRIDLCS